MLEYVSTVLSQKSKENLMSHNMAPLKTKPSIIITSKTYKLSTQTYIHKTLGRGQMLSRLWCTEWAFCRGCLWHKHFPQILPKAQLVPDFSL